MYRMFLPAALFAGLSLTAACTQFPALDRTLTPELEAAEYPALVPLGPVLAASQTPGVQPDLASAQLDARVAALKSRAARLRGSVLSGRARQRLENGLQ